MGLPLVYEILAPRDLIDGPLLLPLAPQSILLKALLRDEQVYVIVDEDVPPDLRRLHIRNPAAHAAELERVILLPRFLERVRQHLQAI